MEEQLYYLKLTKGLISLTSELQTFENFSAV